MAVICCNNINQTHELRILGLLLLILAKQLSHKSSSFAHGANRIIIWISMHMGSSSRGGRSPPGVCEGDWLSVGRVLDFFGAIGLE